MAANDQEAASERDADGLARSIQSAEPSKKGPPPVHLWNPPFSGDLEMRIARDGSWWYKGSPIGRPALVRLFASVLRRDGDDYMLVTPVEKLRIEVEDAPFVAVDFRVEGTGPDQVLTFVTNVGDEAAAGPEHPFRVTRDPETGEPSPYIHIRADLEALIDRKSFYRLIDLGERREVGGETWFGLRSAGEFFPILPASELPD